MPAVTVATPCAAYNRMAENWQIIDALMGGTRPMRQQGTVMLPKEIAESDLEYHNRLNRTFLKPALRNSVEHARGAVFRYEIDTSKVDAKLLPMLDDVDLRGNDMTTFLADGFRDMLTYGHCHLLAAYPTMVPGATLADARAQSARPYGVILDPRNVFSWRELAAQSEEKPDEIRFYERVRLPIVDNQWNADAFSVRVRVLQRGKWQEWELQTNQPLSAVDHATIGAVDTFTAGSNWQLINEGPMVLPSNGGADPNDIPLTTIYGERVDFMESRPPFMDLAWLNVAHWQSYSDYRNILHVAQVPFLFGSGMKAQDSPIVIGVSSAVRADDANAKLMWVEHSGKAIGAGRQELLDLEGAMEKLGAALMSDDKTQPGDETATAVAIDAAQEQATIGGIVRALEDGANQFLWYMGRWIGLQDAGSIEIRRPVAMGGEESLTKPGATAAPVAKKRKPRSAQLNG